jgi:hypothetical protein
MDCRSSPATTIERTNANLFSRRILRPRFANRPRLSFASLKRGRRSAERRIQPWPCRKRGTAARQADETSAIDVRRSPALPGRARLPALHRGTSPIARLISGPRFLELPGTNGRTLPGASAASTSRAGHSAGRYDARSRPGAECVVPPAGTAPAPPCGAPSRRRPSKIRRAGWRMRIIISDACQEGCRRYGDNFAGQLQRRDAGHVLANSVR